MRKTTQKRLICLCLCLCMFMTGCAQQRTAQTEQIPIESTKATERNDVITISTKSEGNQIQTLQEIPVSRPSILVDTRGYQPQRDKMALFLGEELASQFRVIDAETYECVYTGVLENRSYDKENKVYVSQGDFSKVTQPGRYYLEIDKKGRSYTFLIEDDVYEQDLETLLHCKTMFPFEESPQGISDTVYGMHGLMLALECHGTLFEQDETMISRLLEAANWLLTAQDQQTGALYDDYEVTALFCGIMAMCTESFGKYEASLLREYEDAYERAWKWLERHTPADIKEESAAFYAACQLFKIKGTVPLHKTITTYLTKHGDDVLENRSAFYGGIVYLGTQKKTDRELCTALMQQLVEETERICIVARQNPYGVVSQDIGQNLEHMILIGILDYITPSNEYAVVIENMIHYLNGSNKQGICYINEDGSWIDTEETQEQNAQWNAILLYCISDLILEEQS